MRIAVCDDEKIFLDMICNEIEKFYKSLDICCIPFSDGSEVVSAYERGQRFDVIFLDIEMKMLDGMKTAEKIRRFSSDIPIIFLTNHTELAMDGYEVGAFRFLQKPVKKEKLEQALIDIRSFYCKRKTVLLKQGGDEYIIATEDIISVEASNNNVRFVTCDREYTVRMKLSEAMTMLIEAAPYFCKIHRCSIINLGHVISYCEKDVKMDNGKILPMSKSFLTQFRISIFEYVKFFAR